MPGGSRVQIPPSLFVAPLFNNADGTTARDIHSKSSPVRALLGVSSTAAINGADMTRREQGTQSHSLFPQEGGLFEHIAERVSYMARKVRVPLLRSVIGSTTVMTTASSASSAIPHLTSARVLLPTEVPWIGADRHTQQCFQQASRSTDVP